MTADTSQLKSLVKTTIDSAEGYRQAADNAESNALKQVLNDAAAKRRQLVDMLNGELQRLGEDRQEDGSVAGSIHHTWVSITSAFADNDEAAVDRVEEGEDYLKGQFEDALKDQGWQPETRNVLQRAYGEVSEGERLADRLKQAYD
ncbi:ferritin-like domain-containing protein [Pseudohoeflea coraliihabitans]|uniref:PA2169 family four-helix-bundle protein n=1 Tax=Pseudohoeflea coraliihabitans TaxID=2860393 RepID=A0ABS6WNN1_9HYPH|nr:PA2169 family four-helix-bundle protein [Pseudohoeflea sp. DP4N28-3]MBW3097017.1 PA2169 family four-helix-bundle protein [Pseudohoeflea sp. DP4N28-3]